MKSSYSLPNGDCVEVAAELAGVAVRDSVLGDKSPVLRFTRGEWLEFLAGVKAVP